MEFRETPLEPEWLVFFADSDPLPQSAPWSSRFARKFFCLLLKKGFRHCFAARQEGDHLLLFDPMLDRLKISLLPLSAPLAGQPGLFVRDWWAGLLAGEKEGLIHVVRVRPKTNSGLSLSFPLLNCVSLIKRLLNRGGCAITPRQLYLNLKKET